MNKKIIALVLAAAACINLTACTSQTEATAAVQTEAAAVTETAEVSEAAETTAETAEEAAGETTAETTTMPTADENGDFLSAFDQFELTSEDLTDGVWADAIANGADDVSPQLSWEPVEGADQYVIVMVDTTAYYFIHWKAVGVTETTLDRGWAQSDYVGPYPPSGSTHTYDVYVVAIRNPLDRLRGTVNTQNPNFPSFINQIDTDADGNTGNIIAYGRLSGTYTAD